MDSSFQLQEIFGNRPAVLEAEFGPHPRPVEWQHREVIEAFEAEQQPFSRRIATTLIRLRERLNPATAVVDRFEEQRGDESAA